MNYPLPHISTLNRWAAKLQFQRGLLIDVMRFMEIAAMNMNELEKITVIQYDEMKVLSTFEYDKVSDEIVGPHNYVQVIMARSLFGTWK